MMFVQCLRHLHLLLAVLLLMPMLLLPMLLEGVQQRVCQEG
jgi:hypothetical protein